MPGRDPDPCHEPRRKPPAVTPTAASRIPTLDKPQEPAIQRSIPSGKVERSKGDPEPSGSIIPGKACPKFKPRKQATRDSFNSGKGKDSNERSNWKSEVDSGENRKPEKSSHRHRCVRGIAGAEMAVVGHAIGMNRDYSWSAYIVIGSRASYRS